MLDIETPPNVAELSFGMSKKNGTKRQKMTLNLKPNKMEILEVCNTVIRPNFHLRSDGEQSRELDRVLLDASEGKCDGRFDARGEDEGRQEVREKSAGAIAPLESPAKRYGWVHVKCDFIICLVSVLSKLCCIEF